MKRSTLSLEWLGAPQRTRRPRGRTLAAVSSLALLLGFLAPRGAATQPVQNAREAVQDRAALKRDRNQLADDTADVTRLATLIRQLDAARARGDRSAETRCRDQIRTFLRQEVAETRREAAQDRQELRASGQELRSERREVRRDRAELRDARANGTPAETRDARQDLRQDRRDRRDDARDAAESRERLDRERAILAQLRSLQPDIRRGDGRAEARERLLLDEFLSLTRRDARESAKEQREDRREVREDRRERRDDRRERREGK
ncbi:MAG TPA: hypothetical protein VID50_10175 [Candidatus Eisenbacteria bacterium]